MDFESCKTYSISIAQVTLIVVYLYYVYCVGVYCASCLSFVVTSTPYAHEHCYHYAQTIVSFVFCVNVKEIVSPFLSWPCSIVSYLVIFNLELLFAAWILSTGALLCFAPIYFYFI